MRLVSGAVMLLAGALLVGAGVLAHAVADASNKFSPRGDLAAEAGALVAFLGLAVLGSGLRSDLPVKP
jgi:hypothetical protein